MFVWDNTDTTTFIHPTWKIQVQFVQVWHLIYAAPLLNKYNKLIKLKFGVLVLGLTGVRWKLFKLLSHHTPIGGGKLCCWSRWSALGYLGKLWTDFDEHVCSRWGWDKGESITFCWCNISTKKICGGRGVHATELKLKMVSAAVLSVINFGFQDIHRSAQLSKTNCTLHHISPM